MEFLWSRRKLKKIEPRSKFVSASIFYFASIRSETENLRPRNDSTDTRKLVNYKWMWLTMKLTLLLTVVKPDVKQTISTRLIKTKLNHLLYDLMSCKKDTVNDFTSLEGFIWPAPSHLFLSDPWLWVRYPTSFSFPKQLFLQLAI